MKRKYVLGCLGVLVVGGAAILAAGYFYVIRPVKTVMPDLEQIAGLRELNANIGNSAPYSPPGNGELIAEQVERFARVQTSMRAGLGGDFAFLEDRSRKLRGLVERNGEGDDEEVGFREALLAFKDLGPVARRTKELQVDALNREGFSLQEYRWVRESVYNALGFSRANVYLEDFAAAIKGGGSVPDSPDELPPAPEANRDLTARYSGSVPQWHPFYILGM